MKSEITSTFATNVHDEQRILAEQARQTVSLEHKVLRDEYTERCNYLQQQINKLEAEVARLKRPRLIEEGMVRRLSALTEAAQSLLAYSGLPKEYRDELTEALDVK